MQARVFLRKKDARDLYHLSLLNVFLYWRHSLLLWELHTFLNHPQLPANSPVLTLHLQEVGMILWNFSLGEALLCTICDPSVIVQPFLSCHPDLGLGLAVALLPEVIFHPSICSKQWKSFTNKQWAPNLCFMCASICTAYELSPCYLYHFPLFCLFTHFCGSNTRICSATVSAVSLHLQFLNFSKTLKNFPFLLLLHNSMHPSFPFFCVFLHNCVFQLCKVFLPIDGIKIAI